MVQAIESHQKDINEYNGLRLKYISLQNEYSAQCAGKPGTPRCSALLAEGKALFPKVSPAREKELKTKTAKLRKDLEDAERAYVLKCVTTDCRKLVGVTVTPASKTIKAGSGAVQFTAKPVFEKGKKLPCDVTYEWSLEGEIGTLRSGSVAVAPDQKKGPAVAAPGAAAAAIVFLIPIARLSPGAIRAAGRILLTAKDLATTLALSAAATVTITGGLEDDCNPISHLVVTPAPATVPLGASKSFTAEPFWKALLKPRNCAIKQYAWKATRVGTIAGTGPKATLKASKVPADGSVSATAMDEKGNVSKPGVAAVSVTKATELCPFSFPVKDKFGKITLCWYQCKKKGLQSEAPIAGKCEPHIFR